ncbi:hypothetical protein BMW22_15720 [Rhizobium leguminosarum]|uniref:Uncharacterized protein n=1 Tax=Rhizobium leguminosarum TaxID=384 RepID=A0A1L3ZB48_RHILE|nr:hypothetical protein [Rhizobium leguminosarum]API52873.1 hypothetical protein BMW22_15720 [Rhizobium leguminosarum]
MFHEGAAMTEQEIKSEARLMAIERFACHTHNMIVSMVARVGGLSPEQVNSLEMQSLEQLRLTPVIGIPAHISDVLSDEVFLDLKRLVEYAQEMRDVKRD